MDSKKHFKKGKPFKQYSEPDYYTTILKGFLVTSDQHREKNAVKDAYNVLNKYVDDDTQRKIEKISEEHIVTSKKVKKNPHPEQEKSEKTSPEAQEENKNRYEETMQKKLEDELRHYQADTRIFYNVDTNCKGVIFIKVNPLYNEAIDVKKMANKAQTDFRVNKIPIARSCHKLIPVEVATKADFENFKEQIAPMIARKFKAENPKKWVLHFKCRNNNKFSSMKPFLEYIQEIIGKMHSVDYKNPDYTIFIEIEHQLMCLSILKKFAAYKSYGLQGENPNQSKGPTQKKETQDSTKKESVIDHDIEFEMKEDEEPQVNPEKKDESEEEEDVALI